MNILQEIFNRTDAFLGTLPYLDKIPYSTILIPVLLAVVSLLLIYRGQKTIHALKYLVPASAAFIAGYKIIGPAVQPYVTAYVSPEYGEYTPVYVGIILALLGICLCNAAYNIAISGSFAVLAYTVYPILAAMIPPEIKLPVTEQLVSLEKLVTIVNSPWFLVAYLLVVAVLAYTLRGVFEIVVTAFGASLTLFLSLHYLLIGTSHMHGVNGFDNSVLVLGPLTLAVIVCAMIVVTFGVSGLYVQVRDRSRF